jgi:hypothetical protein
MTDTIEEANVHTDVHYQKPFSKVPLQLSNQLQLSAWMEIRADN